MIDAPIVITVRRDKIAYLDDYNQSYVEFKSKEELIEFIRKVACRQCKPPVIHASKVIIVTDKGKTELSGSFRTGIALKKIIDTIENAA